MCIYIYIYIHTYMTWGARASPQALSSPVLLDPTFAYACNHN